MICWIGMMSVSGFCILAYFVIPFLSYHYSWTNGIWLLSHAGEYLDLGIGFELVAGLMVLLGFFASIAWLVMCFLRRSIAGILNVCFAGYLVLMYCVCSLYFTISDNFSVSGGPWFMIFFSGIGLFFAIWALIIEIKSGGGYLGRCPGFGWERYSQRYSQQQQRPVYSQTPPAYQQQQRQVYQQTPPQPQVRGRTSGNVSITAGPYKGSSVPVRNGQRVSIGRSPECTLVIADSAVSRVHCYIVFYASQNMYGITDTSSSGVFDQYRRPLMKNREVMRSPGESFNIGNATVFRLG